MKQYYTTMTGRVAMALGDVTVERLSRVRVAVFGVGGVGSWCAEGLLRTGVVHLTLVDPDDVCPTNVNRQVQAASSTLGKPKVEVLRDRFLEINPGAVVIAQRKSFGEATLPEFRLDDYDYVIDAIDSVADKALLLGECVKAGVTVFSSMGAAARTDPSRIKTAKLSKTHGCPLARAVRRRLRHDGVSADILCVYSDEQTVGASEETVRDFPREGAGCDDGPRDARKRVNGSLVHITAVFGFTLAGLVINDIAGRNGP